VFGFFFPSSNEFLAPPVKELEKDRRLAHENEKINMSAPGATSKREDSRIKFASIWNAEKQKSKLNSMVKNQDIIMSAINDAALNFTLKLLPDSFRLFFFHIWSQSLSFEMRTALNSISFYFSSTFFFFVLYSVHSQEPCEMKNI
jgi:hypothetical protein